MSNCKMDNPNTTVNGDPLKEVLDVTYLGCLISTNGDSREDAKSITKRQSKRSYSEIHLESKAAETENLMKALQQ